MDLVNLELGRWVYLIIYLFFPVITIFYLIRAFGLEVKEDSLTTARRYIEQADYWADIALQSTQPQGGTKSLSSLKHTIQSNLEHADALLQEADPNDEEVKALLRAYRGVEKKCVKYGIVTGSRAILSFPHCAGNH